jgi:putative FmdB family regulatory protein
MPTYEFRCPSGHSFERFYRKMSDAVTELECPVCGKVATRQLSGGAGLVFKGSGFYLTDYGRNAHRNDGGGATASSEKSGSSESKSEGSSSESKTESKAESSKPSPSSGGESKGTDKAGDKGSSKSDSSTASKPSGPKD